MLMTQRKYVVGKTSKCYEEHGEFPVLSCAFLKCCNVYKDIFALKKKWP